MKNTWKFWINSKGYYFFKSYKVYTAYRELIKEELYNKDFNSSFIGQFLRLGFESYSLGWNQNVVAMEGSKVNFRETENKGSVFEYYKSKINPSLNWNGVSLYDPDWLLLKENKAIILSLNGVTAPYDEKYDALFKAGAVKYLKLMIKENIVYEDYSGNLPDKDTINNFLN